MAVSTIIPLSPGGVFLFRLYQWFLPIPLAWILLKIARRSRPTLPTTVERKSLADGSA